MNNDKTNVSDIDYNYAMEKLEQAVESLAHAEGPRKAALKTLYAITPYFRGINAENDTKLPQEIQDKLHRLRELLNGSLEVWDAHKAVGLVCELAFAVCREQAALQERQGMPG